MGLLCSYTSKSTIKMSAKGKAPMRAPQQEVNQTLTLGAVLGAAARRRNRVRQGGLGRVLCCHGRIVLDDNHGDLGPLRRSLGQSPEMEQGFRGKRIRCKIRNNRDRRNTSTTRKKSYSSSSSSSSSELSAERSKSGTLSARRGGGVGSLGRLAGAAAGSEAAAREDPAPVAGTA